MVIDVNVYCVHFAGYINDFAYLFSGYDFGYLLKLLTNRNLPADEQEFFELLRLYFTNIYDVKYLMKSCKNLKGGLQEVAEQLEVSLTYTHKLCSLTQIRLLLKL